MSRFTLLGLLLTTVVGAVPFNIDASKNAIKWISGYNLTSDDIIVPIDGVCKSLPFSYYAP